MSELSQIAELVQRGAVAEAEPRLLQYHEQFPNDIECCNYLAYVEARLGKLEESLRFARRAVQVDPRNATLIANLALILIKMKAWPEAEAVAREALRQDPHHHDAMDFLGRALLNLNQPAEALECFQKVDMTREAEGKPAEPELEFRMGTALMMVNRFEDAEVRLRKALELHELYPDAYNNLGVTLRYLGKYEDALRCYERALQIQHDNADAHLNRVMIWLLQGNFEKGWPEFEWRFISHDLVQEQFAQPLWGGHADKEKTLLLYTEQGLGDTLMLARYFPMVKERVGRLIVECQPVLERWLKGYPEIDEIVIKGHPRPVFDWRLPVFSLAGIFQTTPETIPPVYKPQHDFSGRELVGSGFKVGIVWSGSAKHLDDSVRSCPLKYFLTLAEVPGVKLFSLQKDRKEDLPETVRDAVRTCSDLLETAKVIEHLDLVVTVDTAVAHLAGTLSKPVWLASAIPPDWRWMLEREDSLWYPSVRLFRQKFRGDWPEVFRRIKSELENVSASVA